jgi:hypothetical protein
VKTYEFVVTLAEGTEHSDALVEALYRAGCDDGSVWSCAGVVQIGFSRQADSLEAAIRSAITDVQKVGCTVARLEMEPEALAALHAAPSAQQRT